MNALDFDGRGAEMGMVGYQMAMSTRGVMQRLEMSVERRLWAGMVEQAAYVKMTSEVGDDRTGRRHEQDRSALMARDHAAHVPWRPLSLWLCGAYHSASLVTSISLFFLAGTWSWSVFFTTLYYGTDFVRPVCVHNLSYAFLDEQL